MTFLPLLQTGNVSNTSFYSNEEYDALIEQAMAKTDVEKGLELMKEAENLAMEEYPLIPLYYKSTTYCMKDYVVGEYIMLPEVCSLKTRRWLRQNNFCSRIYICYLMWAAVNCGSPFCT